MKVEELIKYLQTLPPETLVHISVAVQGTWDQYTTFEELEEKYFDFMDGHSPTLFIGET